MKYLSHLLIFYLFLNISFVFCQSDQIYGGIGYNVPTTTSVIGGNISNGYLENNHSTFSRGINFQVGYLLGVSKGIFIDINASYLYGVKKERYFSNDNESQLFGEYDNSNIAFSPSINMKYRLGDFSPFIKFGASVNFIQIEIVRKYKLNPTSSEKYLYKNNLTFGWIAGIGLDYLIQKNLVIFTELQLNSITFYPDEVEYTKVTANSKNTNTFHPKEKIFVGDTPGHGASELVQDYPFSSIGILIGLRFNI